MADDIDWSSDDIPVPDAPTEVVWSRHAPAHDDEISMRPADPPSNARLGAGGSPGNGVKLLVVAALLFVVAVVVGLVGSTSATAAPRDNVVNAGKCLWGGWRSLQPSPDTSFNRLAGCLIFALRGGTFHIAAPPSNTE